MVKKTKETVKRDKAGRFKKGTPGGPGRKKGEPRDIIYKDGKKRSVATLIDDLLAAYETLGGDKFLKKWATHSHRNLARFIEILFKFAPQPQDANRSSNTIFEISEKFMPKIKIERIISDVRPDEMGDPLGKRIKYLEDRLKEKDKEISRLRASVNVHDTKEIEHEPICSAELPEHTKAEKQSKDSTNQKSK